MIKIKSNINLYDSITCGQIFRYIIKDNTYYLILSDRIVKLIDKSDFIEVYSSNEDNLEEVISTYLDLKKDYESINEYLIKNNSDLGNIINKCKGFKVFKTPYLETIVSYMISANNNVRNITNSVNLISEKYGKKVIFEGNTYYLFPTLDKLKELSIDDYKDLKLGFRSEYVYLFINKITNKDINNISLMNTTDALDYLMSFKGIGMKVASCILLFGYSRLDVFPIDTWVKKYMYDNYGINDINKIKDYAKKLYKEYSGLVIQYMFHSKRNIKDISK